MVGVTIKESEEAISREKERKYGTLLRSQGIQIREKICGDKKSKGEPKGLL